MIVSFVAEWNTSTFGVTFPRTRPGTFHAKPYKCSHAVLGFLVGICCGIWPQSRTSKDEPNPKHHLTQRSRNFSYRLGWYSIQARWATINHPSTDLTSTPQPYKIFFIWRNGIAMNIFGNINFCIEFITRLCSAVGKEHRCILEAPVFVRKEQRKMCDTFVFFRRSELVSVT